ncbi:hypothetical protein, partial [Actinocrinis sp.]|uniref:hypothetical protein n=1 Tax=Actinocrinis sp. TaxID=1920516 RepID=UPI002D35ED9D
GSSGSYVWAGTTYASGQADAFRTQTGQGVHDNFAAVDNQSENQPYIELPVSDCATGHSGSAEGGRSR